MIELISDSNDLAAMKTPMRQNTREAQERSCKTGFIPV